MARTLCGLCSAWAAYTLHRNVLAQFMAGFNHIRGVELFDELGDRGCLQLSLDELGPFIVESMRGATITLRHMDAQVQAAPLSGIENCIPRILNPPACF